MLRSTTDTICALATPPGSGGLAVIRVSGENAFELSDRLLRQKRPNSRYRGYTLHRAEAVDGDDVIDDVIVSIFHAPKSFTGENTVEISCHGGCVPVSRILRGLLNAGCRAAGPGEFTQRAYLNSKMDLAQAEAVCDLINARTDEAYRQAQLQQRGRLSFVVNEIRESLLGILAKIEASIDFSEDVGELNITECAAELSTIENILAELARSADRGILLREGALVVLAGRPNAGKSSLMNALLRQDRAIVTEVPGTTRDTLEETVNIQGIAIRLWDTAGLRPTTDPVESMGVERSHAAIKAADLVLLVIDATVGIEDQESRLVGEIAHEKLLAVWNKCDICSAGDLQVSATTGAGLDILERAIGDRLIGSNSSRDSGDGAVLSHTHQLEAVCRALISVHNAQHTIEDSLPVDFLSIDVHSALTALGAITGQTSTDDIINEIFAKFCIGK